MMHALDYAEAIYLAAQGKDDSALDRLAVRVREVVDANGHRALFPAIVQECSELYRKRERAGAGVVWVARAGDADVYADRIAEDASVLGVSDATPTVACDETLIGGYELRTQGSRIDRTHKRALVELYSALISRS